MQKSKFVLDAADGVICPRCGGTGQITETLREQLADNRALILVQHKHLIDACHVYQKAHSWTPEQYPDIGELLRWLMSDAWMTHSESRGKGLGDESAR